MRRRSRVNQAIDIYRCERGELRATATFAHEEHWRGVAFAAPSVLCASVDDSVYVIDLANPAAPRARARLGIAGAGEMVAAAGHVFVRGDDALWVLACRDASAPRVVARIPGERMPRVARDGDHVWLAENGHVWVLDPATGEFLAHWLVLGPDGSGMDDVHALWRDGDAICAVTPNGLVRAPVLRDELIADAQRAIASERERVETAVRTAVDAWLGGPSEPVGTIAAMWYGWGARISMLPPTSVLSLLRGEFAHSEDVSFEQRDGDDERDDSESDAARTQGREVSSVIEAARQHQRTSALRELLRGLAPTLADATHAAPHVMAVITGDNTEVVDVFATRGTATAERTAIEPVRPRSTLERFTSDRWYSEVDTWIARAKRDTAFRDEVLGLLGDARLACGSTHHQLAEAARGARRTRVGRGRSACATGRVRWAPRAHAPPRRAPRARTIRDVRRSEHRAAGAARARPPRRARLDRDGARSVTSGYDGSLSSHSANDSWHCVKSTRNRNRPPASPGGAVNR